MKKDIKNENGKSKKEKMEALKAKIFSKEVILYVVFGVITTLVNWVTFGVLTKLTPLNENISNIIAIVTSIIVAYLTNRSYVFNSQAKGFKELSVEFAKFMGGRAITMIIEWGLDAVLFLTSIPQMITKVGVSIIVVVLNYFISKYFSFKNKK